MKTPKVDFTLARVIATWGGVTLGCLALLALLVVAGEVAYARLNENRIFPGVRVLGVRLDGMLIDEARESVQKSIDTALAQGIRFRFRNQDVQLDVTTPASGPDASRDLIRYDIEPAIQEAYRIGRDGSWWKRVREQMDSRVGPTMIPTRVDIDAQGISAGLETALDDAITKPKNATFIIEMATGSEPFIHIDNERSGLTFDAKHAFTVLRTQAERLAFAPIELDTRVEQPTLRREDVEPFTEDVKKILSRPPMTLTYEQEKFAIPMKTVAGWITMRTEDGRPTIAYDEQAVVASIRKIAPEIEQEAKNGSLVIKDGKIDSFVAGTQGVSIDAASTTAQIATRWPEKTSLPIIVTITSGSLLGEDPERLGIKEIIGVGRSNFSGSPSNRRKNIRLGAEKVNGTIIPPGGEFSLLKTLGEIDGAHGWLPELVIKGDKTTPEFGGGLCQIGTTSFRGALDSGLKIVERRNHSYRVRYYEPAGTDATIYDPSPDFRFQNDTEHSILINAYIKGDNVVFEFWGTKDGRKSDPIKPSVYNITSPPPMKLVETLDLPPGQKKCTESAHAGADASFTYRVTYADGTEHKEVFTSHYRPWQAVCLIGVTELTKPAETPVLTP